MSFAPDQQSRVGMPNTTRTILFWVLMVALATVLWQMASKSPNQKSVPSMTYSDFMNHVDNNNVATAKLFDWKETAEIDGQLRQPPQQFKVTIPKEVIPDLTERLRKQGVSIDVSNASEPNWQNVALNLSPFVVILGLWFFMMRQRRIKRDQSMPGDPSNRPIQ